MAIFTMTNGDTPEHQQKVTDCLAHCLAHISIVLVGTTLPANIGSVARAMKTMGFHQLVLVNPKKPIDDTALATAAGAKDVLDDVLLVDTIEAALADSQLVFATSSRTRSLPWPQLNIKQGADVLKTNIHALNVLADPDVTKDPHSKDTDHQTLKFPKVSVVFGRENSGLTNAELALANFHLSIPASTSYGILNLASAAQVICYEFRAQMESFLSTYLIDLCDLLDKNSINFAQMGIIKQSHTLNTAKSSEKSLTMKIRTAWDEDIATQQQINQLHEKILDIAQNVDLYDINEPRLTPMRLKRVLARTQLDRMEYNFLRAFLAKIEKKLHGK